MRGQQCEAARLGDADLGHDRIDVGLSLLDDSLLLDVNVVVERLVVRDQGAEHRRGEAREELVQRAEHGLQADAELGGELADYCEEG